MFKRVIATLDKNLSCDTGELHTLATIAQQWEIPYGMAWLLRLKRELDDWLGRH